jgi:hypothetical protein
MSANGGAVSVRAGTVVAPGIERAPAQGAGSSSGLDEAGNGDGEGARPLPRELDGGPVAVVDSSESHLYDPLRCVKGEGDLADHKIGFVLTFEGEILGEVPGTPEVVEYRPNPLGHGGELLFLHLHDDESTPLANLEEKEAVAHDSAGSDHHAIGLSKGVNHEGTSSVREEVEFTPRTRGPVAPSKSALTEQVEMTVR